MLETLAEDQRNLNQGKNKENSLVTSNEIVSLHLIIQSLQTQLKDANRLIGRNYNIDVNLAHSSNLKFASQIKEISSLVQDSLTRIELALSEGMQARSA